VVSGPGSVQFGNATAVDTTATFSATGTYVLRLTANDGDQTAHDDLTVDVAPPSEPASGLTGHWRLDRPLGSIAPDASGLGIDDVRIYNRALSNEEVLALGVS